MVTSHWENNIPCRLPYFVYKKANKLPYKTGLNVYGQEHSGDTTPAIGVIKNVNPNSLHTNNTRFFEILMNGNFDKIYVTTVSKTEFNVEIKHNLSIE